VINTKKLRINIQMVIINIMRLILVTYLWVVSELFSVVMEDIPKILSTLLSLCYVMDCNLWPRGILLFYVSRLKSPLIRTERISRRKSLSGTSWLLDMCIIWQSLTLSNCKVWCWAVLQWIFRLFCISATWTRGSS
jgi:hypothetical protein